MKSNRQAMQLLALLSLLLTAAECLDDSIAVDIGKNAVKDPGVGNHPPHSPLTKEHIVDGHHNEEFDHEAVLGSRDLNEEFGEMAPDLAIYQLGLLVDKHDMDGDGFISREELIEWILHSFRSLDMEEAQQKMQQEDTDEDGVVSLDEMLTASYHYSPEELQDLAEDKNPDIQSFMDLVRLDTMKFQAADLDQDGSLEVHEFAAYLHPYHYPFTQDFEVNLTMVSHDKNGDHKIDLDEYMGDKDKNPETQIVDKENFNYYDTNGDGFLDLQEIRPWVLPELDQMAEDEARHLLAETDSDNDGKLTKEEIQKQHELWVGSQAANEIHMESEPLLQHDPGEL